MDELQDESWEAKIVEQNINRVKLSVNSPVTAVIGKYKLTIATQCLKTGETTTHDHDKDIYMLFNPWCEGKIDRVPAYFKEYFTQKLKFAGNVLILRQIQDVDEFVSSWD